MSVFLTVGTGKAATFEGQMVRVTEEIGGSPVIFTDVLVGSGFELTGFSAFNFDIDIAASSITLRANDPIPPAAGFFGFGFADYQTSMPRILSVMIDEQDGFGSFGASNFGVIDDGDKIFVDFSSVSIGSGDRLVLGVTFAPATGVVPLPATLPLMLGGVAALTAFRRRRRA